MKKIIISLFVFLPLLLAATVIPGGDVSGVWNVAGNPYYIDGDIFLQAGDELQIEAGVEVIFNEFYKLEIYGRLTALGTPENMISFTALDNNTGWHGLRFIDGNLSSMPANILTYCSLANGYALGQNEDQFGGAIYCFNSANLVIQNCNFSQNYAALDGGAICLEEDSDILISNCIFSNNNCGFFGGSIIAYGSDPVIEYCSFMDNNSAVFAAGFSSWDNSAPELYNCIFSSNSSGACSGIYCVDSNVKMANILFYNNTTDFGSGAACGLTNCTTEVSNITAVANVSPLSGGAFWLNGGSLTISNSILWNNLPEDIYVLSGSASAAYSCISDGFAGTMVISEDPLFQDYNGEDYHLQGSSPCVDTGDAAVVGFALPEFDLDGNDRIVDGDEDGTATIDMGAYEFFIPGPENGYIGGLVTDTGGTILEGAMITAGIYTAYSDAEGIYLLEVEAGDYTVNCALEGYLAADPVEITVSPAETVTVNFSMEPEVSADDPLSQTFLDKGNYPNPFNPDTYINFQLKESSLINLEIYNARGQMIRTLLQENLPSGEHSILWNGKDEQGNTLNSGIYFYRIQSASTTSVNKMILMK
jgi:predicted outer membrane repeat protein